MYVPLRKRISRAIRGHLRAATLGSHGRGILAETRNGSLVVDPRDFGVSRALLSRGAYDWDDICWLSPLLSPDSTLIVVGAHLGALLIPLITRSGVTQAIAFEPSPRNHQLLRWNLALNGLAQVRVEQQAIGNQPGQLAFVENETNSGNSRIGLNGGLTVPVTTLDDVIPSTWNPDLLVLDVEGFEMHALQGASKTLSRTKYCYLEFAPEQLEEQGSTVDQLITLISSRYPSMYLRTGNPQFMLAEEYTGYLRRRATQHGLLLNLLLADDLKPDPRLI